MNRGRFIVLEGIEGAGKSTQVVLLREWLRSKGVSFRVAREPGGTPLGEEVREIFLHREELDPSPVSELFLILAARAATVREVVRPALAAGEWVLVDRFDLSTLAYQGYGRGLDLETIREMNDFAVDGVHPDLYLLFDIPVGEGARRRLDRPAEDRMEGAGPDFLERVRQGYLELARTDRRVRRIDATVGAQAVHEEVIEAMVGTFPERFAGRSV